MQQNEELIKKFKGLILSKLNSEEKDTLKIEEQKHHL